MTEAEMREGFKRGRNLTQEEWADRSEIEAVDRLLAEGVCVLVQPWKYSGNFQCKYRKVRGAALSTLPERGEPQEGGAK